MTPDISNSQEDQKPGRGIKSSRYLEIARKEFFTQRKLLFLITHHLQTTTLFWSNLLQVCQWTHLRQFAIDSTSKLHAKCLSIFYRLWKSESMWKGCYRLDVDSSMSIRLPKLMKYGWVFYIVFLRSFRCRFDLTSKLAAWCYTCSCFQFVLW